MFLHLFILAIIYFSSNEIEAITSIFLQNESAVTFVILALIICFGYLIGMALRLVKTQVADRFSSRFSKVLKFGVKRNFEPWMTEEFPYLGAIGYRIIENLCGYAFNAKAGANYYIYFYVRLGEKDKAEFIKWYLPDITQENKKKIERWRAASKEELEQDNDFLKAMAEAYKHDSKLGYRIFRKLDQKDRKQFIKLYSPEKKEEETKKWLTASEEELEESHGFQKVLSDAFTSIVGSGKTIICKGFGMLSKKNKKRVIEEYYFKEKEKLMEEWISGQKIDELKRFISDVFDGERDRMFAYFFEKLSEDKIKQAFEQIAKDANQRTGEDEFRSEYLPALEFFNTYWLRQLNRKKGNRRFFNFCKNILHEEEVGLINEIVSAETSIRYLSGMVWSLVTSAIILIPIIIILDNLPLLFLLIPIYFILAGVILYNFKRFRIKETEMVFDACYKHKEMFAVNNKNQKSKNLIAVGMNSQKHPSYFISSRRH